MSSEQGSFTGVAGRKIVWQGWSAPATPQAVVTIVHGYGEHVGRYEHVATRLTETGYQVYGLDHHGHGRSEGRRGQISLSAAVTDLDQLVTGVSRGRHPGVPQFLLGHSLGGAIALRYAIAHQDRLDGMVVSAPLAAVAEGPAMQSVGKLLGVVAPSLPVARVDPQLVSRDQQVVADYEADPLNYHGRISARVAREFILHAQSLPVDVRRITLPTLLMWGTHDRLCPVAGAEMVAREIGSSDLTVKPYEGLYHEIMNAPERETVIDNMLAWLRDRTGADSSGAGTGSGPTRAG